MRIEIRGKEVVLVANKDSMLTLRDLADEFCCSVPTIKKFVDRGELKPDVVKIAESSGNYTARYWKQSTVDAFKQKYAKGKYDGSPLVGVADFADYLGVDKMAIQKMIFNGDLIPDIVLPVGSIKYTTEIRLFSETHVKAFAAEWKATHVS